LYSIRFPDLTGFLVITVAISMAVGGLAAWIASMSYRMDSRVIINLFASFIIYILGFIGGSFFPIGDYSRIIQMIGNATPNGAGMTAYLTVMRGGSLSDVSTPVISLILFAIVMLVAAIVCFPKRGVET